MIIYSQTYPGLYMTCPECGCLFGYNNKDIYENKYVYCPVCRAKLNTNVQDVEWHYAVEEKKDENNTSKQ